MLKCVKEMRFYNTNFHFIWFNFKYPELKKLRNAEILSLDSCENVFSLGEFCFPYAGLEAHSLSPSLSLSLSLNKKMTPIKY